LIFFVFVRNLAAAVLGIAMIAMGEEIGSEMALRSFGHLVNNQFLIKKKKKNLFNEFSYDMVNR